MNDAEAIPSLPATAGAADRDVSPRRDRKLTPPPPPDRDVQTKPQTEDQTKADSGGGRDGVNNGGCDSDGDGTSSPKADSEAETIIQPGRDEASPEKKKKFIKHEREPSDERNSNLDRMDVDGSPDGERPRKRKRMENDPRDSRSPDSRPRRARSPKSAGLEVSRLRKSEDFDSSSARRSSHQSLPASSETGNGNVVRKRSSSEGLVERESKSQRVSKQQHRDEISHPKKRTDKNNISYPRRLSNGRSVSPPRSSRDRDTPVSTVSGDVVKKKRVPTPLITTHQRHSSEDRRSVSSSVSGSPLPSGRSRKPTSHEYTPTSPAKQMQHKKRRDQNGRTRLARACAAQEVDSARARLQERPEDLNIPDNAGNTPLQIAALMGCAPIVKILINAGCEIDTKNIDKDTPLIDAVENGHLDVVKALLDAGASPRVLNAQGDEPYELVPTDHSNYEALRKLIANVKANDIRRRRSDDQTRRESSSAKEPSSRGASAQSPRDSPPTAGARSPPPASMVTSSRRRTVRSEVTRNDLLWTKATPENLQNFAAKGDMAGVANILNVGQKADAESLIAAAKGGHDEVLGILLGMGDPDPDPEPLRSGNHRAGYNTPMLAAIGKGNLAIIQLLLDQRGFNPTRRDHRGRTYYEISRERRGDHWTKEFDLLREAFESHASKVRKMRKPENNVQRKPRDNEKDMKRPERRGSSSPVAHPQRRVARSPVSNRHQDGQSREPVREKKREGFQAKDRLGSVPTGPRGKAQDRDGNNSEHSVNTTDQDTKHARSKGSISGKGQGDLIHSSQGDDVVKRRRLIAGRPPQEGNRRRGSLISSDSLSGREEMSKPRLQQRQSSDNKGLKPGGPSLKRSRSSVTPDRSRSRDPDSRRDSHGGVQKKRQRVRSVDSMSKSANGDPRKNQESSNEYPSKAQARRSDSISAKPDRVKTQSSGNATTKDSGKVVTSTENSSIKQEPKKSTAINSIPIDTASQQAPQRVTKDSEKKEPERKSAAMDPERAKSAKEVKDARDKEEKRVSSEEEKAKLAKEAEEKRAAAEAERARAAKEAKEAKQAKEAKEAKEAEEKRIAEEAERARAAKEAKEAEEKRIADEAERAKAAKEAKEAREAREEEDRRAAAEAERIRAAKEAEEAREAAERAARIAREKAEEEERKRKEAEQRRIKQAEDERQKRIEQERQRQARLRKEQEEQEQRRRDALPNRLRVAANLVGANDSKAKNHAWLKKFLPLVTATTRQIEPSCEVELESEKWIPNYLVAPLLATNDLQLSQYTSWEKRPATSTQRNNLWRVTRRILIQGDEQDFLSSSYQSVMQMDIETRPKYFAMDHVFWVRLSDFMDLVPHIPHLHGLPIQEQKIHVDPEPSADGPSQQPNGHISGSPISDNEPRPSLTNGLGINGVSHA